MSVEITPSERGSLQSQGSTPLTPPRRNPGPQKKSMVARLWDVLQPLTRLWGLVTAIMMSGAGAELLVLGYEVAPVLLAGAAFIFILETMWVAALFVDLLCRRGEYSVGLRCWDFMRWSCGRARAPFYACVATALLFANLSLLATVSGGMLLAQALLRALVPFSPHATHGPHSPRAGSVLISQYDSPLPDVFYNAANTGEDRLDNLYWRDGWNSRNNECEEMTDLKVKSPGRSRSTTPKPPLLEI